MRCAVTTRPGVMVIDERPDPVPQPGYAVVDVELVGLCGSDFHIYDGNHPYLVYPQVQGHEVVGVLRQGGNLAPGTRVAIEPLLPCGQCYACQQGKYNCCSRLEVLGVHLPGGLATSIAVPDHRIHSVGDLAPEYGVLVEPMAVGLQAIERAGLRRGDSLVVIGAGSIGRSVTLAAVDAGARVLVADREPARLALAKQLGAEVVVNSLVGDLGVTARAHFGEDGPAFVIEATGAPAEIREALDVVAASGTVVIVGVSDGEVSIPVSIFTRKEVNLLGSRNSRNMFARAVALVTRHELVLGTWISHRFPLDRAEEALIFARDNPSKVTKVVVDMTRNEGNDG